MGLINKRTLLLGGLAVAAVAGALKNRERVAGLIGARTGASEPPPPEPVSRPTPSNYDVGGPVENTATKVPAPEPVVRGEGGIDERAEEEAAAAEAAAIGGSVPDYAGTELGEEASESERPLMEAGGGESEGQEQAESDLRDNAEPSAGDPIEGGRQIEEVIEQADDPTAGEQVEPLVREDPRAEAEQAAAGTSSPLEDPGPDAEPSGTAADAEPRAPQRDEETGPLGGAQSSFFAGGKEGTPDEEPETPEGAGAGLPDQGAAEAAERAAGSETPPQKKSSAVWAPSERKGEDDEDDTGEWQTWSGRAVEP